MDLHSPLLIPLGAFAVAIVAIVSGVAGEAHKMRLKADQRIDHGGTRHERRRH